MHYVTIACLSKLVRSQSLRLGRLERTGPLFCYCTRRTWKR